MRLFTVHVLDEVGQRCASDGLLRATTLYEAHSLAKGRLDHSPVVEIWEEGRCVMRLDRETHFARLARIDKASSRRRQDQSASAGRDVAIKA